MCSNCEAGVKSYKAFFQLRPIKVSYVWVTYCWRAIIGVLRYVSGMPEVFLCSPFASIQANQNIVSPLSW